jgi:5-methylcytosine-specific restriction endonuclease McrA
MSRKSGASRPELSTYRWKRRRAAVRARDRIRCVRCAETRGLSVHHLVPAWAGGGDEMQNLVLLCSRCHHRVEPRRPGGKASGAAAVHPRSRQPRKKLVPLAGPFSRAW